MGNLSTPIASTAGGSGRRVAVAARMFVRGLDDRIRARGAAWVPTWVPATATSLADLPEGCEALIIPIGSSEDPAAVLARLCGDEGPRALALPVIAFCEDPTPEAAAAAIAAGAADCAALDDPRPATVLARGVAQWRRLEDERTRALTDLITGLYNRRFFHERLEEEENKAYRTGLAVALVLVDLDHFKAVNDTFGHGAGDRVLHDVGQILRHCIRNYDVACRVGGEEFALILPASSIPAAHHVAERVRTEVKAHRFEGLPAQLRITVSCGVAALPATGVATKDELVRAADRALYDAKHSGRDRTHVAADSLDGSRVAAGASDARVAMVLERVERLRASVRALTHDITTRYLDSVEALAKILDPEEGSAAPTFGRAQAIAGFAGEIAAAMELGVEQCERIRRAALFQEVGMIPLAPLVGRAGDLTADEVDLIRQHPALSARIADEVHFLREELPLILHHHERVDGSGYPRGLKGDRIPLGARILAVATAYEAMTTVRPYRGAMAHDTAIAEIDRLAGSWYDTRVVTAFRAACGRGLRSATAS